MKLGEIANALNVTLESGSPETEVTGVAGIEEAVAGQITFVANPKYAAAARTTAATVVIVSEDFPATGGALLRSKNPYLSFARAIDLFYQPPRYFSRGSSDGSHRAEREDRSKRAHWRLRGD